MDTSAINWPGVSEIKFMTGSEKVLQGNRKLWCKIKCVEGQWVGPLCSTDGGNTMNSVFIDWLTSEMSSKATRGPLDYTR